MMKKKIMATAALPMLFALSLTSCSQLSAEPTSVSETTISNAEQGSVGPAAVNVTNDNETYPNRGTIVAQDSSVQPEEEPSIGEAHKVDTPVIIDDKVTESASNQKLADDWKRLSDKVDKGEKLTVAEDRELRALMDTFIKKWEVLVDHDVAITIPAPPVAVPVPSEEIQK